MRVGVSKNPDRGGRCYKCVEGSRVFAIAGMSGELKHFDVNPGFVILRIFIFLLPTITMILDFTGKARFYTGDFTLHVKSRFGTLLPYPAEQHTCQRFSKFSEVLSLKFTDARILWGVHL